jgi:hypothetical protein
MKVHRLLIRSLFIAGIALGLAPGFGFAGGG